MKKETVKPGLRDRIGLPTLALTMIRMNIEKLSTPYWVNGSFSEKTQETSN